MKTDKLISRRQRVLDQLQFSDDVNYWTDELWRIDLEILEVVGEGSPEDLKEVRSLLEIKIDLHEIAKLACNYHTVLNGVATARAAGDGSYVNRWRPSLERMELRLAYYRAALLPHELEEYGEITNASL